ncbi:MAG: dipeptide ABC transporter ATP-binding protein [Elusimicrobia bacterium]|nr:dipeptide ABC transporter ATP-binding protein [Elusimicrobiota bacterium]
MKSSEIKPLLEVRDVRKHFSLAGGFFERDKARVTAVDGVSFEVRPGETLGIVGESGCGKTTLGRLILGLEAPSSGEVIFEGSDIHRIASAELRKLRRHMQIIFQDPFSSLNPRMTIEQIVAEPLEIHGVLDGSDRLRKVAELLDRVGLPQSACRRYPHEFSGGQRQRVGIARAIALNPRLIIADEPVSALDVSIQAQVINLLGKLQRELGLTYIFIAHDLAVVKHVSTRIAVMYLGKIVEIAGTDEIFSNPQHPYTEALLSAVPIPDPNIEGRRKRILLQGDVPSPIRIPPGCRFHTRCNYAQPSCSTQSPELAAQSTDFSHLAACPVAPFKTRRSVAALAEEGQ